MKVAIIGGGPAGLIAAETLAAAGGKVRVYDRMPSLARRLLMAGRGGLNLSHGEELEILLGRYGAARPFLEAAIRDFPPAALRAWAEGLGIETFVGSSGRIFPRPMKASPLLRAWLRRLDGLGVEFALSHHWQGWDAAGRLVFRHADATITAEADATLLALGGGSWTKLGADPGWVQILRGKGVAVADLSPANCGVDIAWSAMFKARFAGTPLKNIALIDGDRRATGEAMVTEYGLEGSAVYGLALDGPATIAVDLKPDLALEVVGARLTRTVGQSLANRLRKLGLAPAMVHLLREGGELPKDAAGLAARIKAAPLRVVGVQPLARAISSAGGVRFAAIDANYQLKALPGVFVAGEMLDWRAPTGGYLLQACFATGRAAAFGMLRRFNP